MHSPEWSKLFGDAAFQHPPSELELPEQEAAPAPSQDVVRRHEAVASAVDQEPASSQDADVPAAQPETSSVTVQAPTPVEQPVPSTLTDSEPATQPVTDSTAIGNSQTVTEPSQQSQGRRSGRQRRAPDGLGSFEFCDAVPSVLTDEFGPCFHKVSNDPDTLTCDKAMHAPDRDKFVEAMMAEIKALVDNDTWDEAPESNAVGRILPGAWAFKCKRTSEGLICKCKGRHCCRDDLVEGDFITHAPVAGNVTGHLHLGLTMTLDWQSVAMDWTNAFAQAPLDAPVWIHVPRGFSAAGDSERHLRLKKSLCGASVAPRAWFRHLLATLLDVEFNPVLP